MSHFFTRSRIIFGVLVAAPGFAWANGFLPTMISANILWLLVLPLVVLLEGWFLKRWGWRTPYKVSFFANLISMVAAIPFGIGLSALGAWLVPMRGNGGYLTQLGVSQDAQFFIGQVLLYGQAGAPSFGLAGGPP